MKLSGCELLKEVSDMSGAPNLKKLHLDNCKELREIRGLPPNIEYLSAINYTLLTSKSKERLMNKVSDLCFESFLIFFKHSLK